MIEVMVTFTNEDDYAWFVEIMRESKEAGDLEEPFSIERAVPRGVPNITRRAGLFGEVIDG